MKCIICENFSFSIICKSCQDTTLHTQLDKRELSKDFFVYSFYSYEQIKDLINSKYYFYGDRVYKILANLAFKKFAQNFSFEYPIDIITINDNNDKEYNQAAILSKHLRSKTLKPKYNLLEAKNKIKYAGKSLKFRQENPRNFVYKGEKNRRVILVDDLVTTGSTLLEAKKILEKNGCDVLFALTLSNAKN